MGRCRIFGGRWVCWFRGRRVGVGRFLRFSMLRMRCERSKWRSSNEKQKRRMSNERWKLRKEMKMNVREEKQDGQRLLRPRKG